MKLGTIQSSTPDGCLVIVNRSLTLMVSATAIAPTMRDALDRWEEVSPALEELYALLNDGQADGAQPFDPKRMLAPLPRAYAWIDGTSYLAHMKRARELRGAELPDDFSKEPLMTERVSVFLGPCAPLPLPSSEVGMDIEGEVGVILGDVPVGTNAEEAAKKIRLITLINDVSLRTVLAEAVLRGRPVTLFAKPYPTMAPVAVTPDELGEAWDGNLVRMPLHCHINGELLAAPDGGKDASFTFPQLISYCATYRPLPSGTVLAAGTLSNYDDDVGGACIAEKRLIEQKRLGYPVTPYLDVGDSLNIEMMDHEGRSIFGPISQAIISA